MLVRLRCPLLRLPFRGNYECFVRCVAQVNQLGCVVDHHLGVLSDFLAVLGKVQPPVAVQDVVIGTERPYFAWGQWMQGIGGIRQRR